MDVSTRIDKIPFGSSLVVRSLCAMVLLLSIIFSAALAFTAWNERRKSYEELSTSMQEVGHITGAAISLSLWNLDKPQVESQLLALKNVEAFCGVQVHDISDAVFATLDYPAQLSPTQWVTTVPILFKNPLSDASAPEKIGTLILCADSVHTEAMLKEHLLKLSLYFLVAAASIIIATYIALSIITRPLLKLRDAIDGLVHTMQPIRNKDLLKANEIGVLAHSFNATTSDLANATKEAIIAKDMAERASHAKSDFLANMTHELRTPLNSIIGMTRLLSELAVTDEQKNMFGAVQQSSDILLGIVNDVLDISKIEAGEITLEHIGFDAESAIRRVVNTLRYMAEKKGLTLACHFAEQPPFFLGDPLRVSQVITNLINNAIKYTLHGSVTIQVSFSRQIGRAHV